MGNIPIFQPQVSPISDIPQPTASPEDLGAGVGRALFGLGQNIVSLGAAFKAHEDQQNGIAARLALSKARLDMTQALIDQENNAGPGGEGLVEGWMKTFDDYSAKIGDTIPAGKARDAFTAGMAELRTSLGTQAIGTGAKMRVAKTAADAHSALDIGINTVTIDPTQYDAVIKQGYSTIDALNLPVDDRTALKQEFTNSAAAARFSALFTAAKTPDAVDGIIKDLETGDWKKALGPKSFDDLLDLARRMKTSTGTLVKTQADAAVDSVESRIKDGAAIDPQEIADVTAAVRKTADVALTRRWMVLSTQYDTQQKVKTLSTPDLRGYITTMRGNVTGPVGAAAIIREEEGFRTNAYFDVNHYRVGFGSDTYTTADGHVHEVTAGTTVTPEDAERDLNRRIGEFTARAAGQVGQDRWNNLPDNARSGLVSVAYNYGSLPASVVTAAQTGDVEAIAQAVEKLDANPARRLREAAIIRGANAPTPTEISNIKADAAQKMLDAREQMIGQSNIMGAAQQAGIATVAPLTDPESYQRRAVEAQTAARYFDDATKPFTPDEVEKFKEVMEKGTIDDKLAVLSNVAAMGDVAKDAFKQIGEKSPLLGYVGGLAAQNPSLARDVLRGQQLMQDNPDSKSALFLGGSDNSGSAQTFATVVGNALQLAPETAQAARLAADALYVHRTGLAGANLFDAAQYRKAVADVLGGVNGQGGLATINGHPTVLPPGVSETEFEAAINNLTDDDLIQHSVGGGPPYHVDAITGAAVPATAEDIASEGQFRSVGAGSYIVYMADNAPLLGSRPDGYYGFQIDKAGVAAINQRAAAAPTSGTAAGPPDIVLQDFERTLRERAPGMSEAAIQEEIADYRRRFNALMGGRR